MVENKNGSIYFDNGSTSYPKAPNVAREVGRLLEEGAFNINRGNYEGAYEVADKVLETREQLEFLSALHCTQIQGFYYSPPLPADRFFQEHMGSEDSSSCDDTD